MKQKMLIIGLTGGIGMGKSTAAKIMNGFGLPVYCADKAVHALLAKKGKAVKPVARLFPETLQDGAIDRRLLGQAVFHDPARLKKLEKILHPLVQSCERAFLAKARQQKAPAVVLEIPLLFETGAQKRCDVVICVTAPLVLQRERVMKRKGMTAARFNAIRKRQLPDTLKRKAADYVVKTGVGYADTKKQVRMILNQLLLDALG